MRASTFGQLSVLIFLALALLSIRFPGWHRPSENPKVARFFEKYLLLLLGLFGLFVTWHLFSNSEELGETIAILSMMGPLLIIIGLVCLAIPILSIVALFIGIKNLIESEK